MKPNSPVTIAAVFVFVFATTAVFVVTPAFGTPKGQHRTSLTASVGITPIVQRGGVVDDTAGRNRSQKRGRPSATPDKPIVFKKRVRSNVTVPKGLDGLVFFDTEGKRVALKSFLGKKHVVLVFTEGFNGGMICPFCQTQTSRLISNYKKFQALDAEVLVVYPGARDHLDEFIAAAQKSEQGQDRPIPFPLVLDEDLKAVGFFNIESNLAHPSTFIIDKKGNVKLAYVGNDMTADRPSVRAMLRVLQKANRSLDVQ